MTDKNAKPKRRPSRIPVAQAVEALVLAGVDPNDIVIDTVNHRVFVDRRPKGNVLADGARADWSEVVKL